MINSGNKQRNVIWTLKWRELMINYFQLGILTMTSHSNSPPIKLLLVQVFSHRIKSSISSIIQIKKIRIYISMQKEEKQKFSQNWLMEIKLMEHFHSQLKQIMILKILSINHLFHWLFIVSMISKKKEAIQKFSSVLSLNLVKWGLWINPLIWLMDLFSKCIHQQLNSFEHTFTINSYMNLNRLIFISIIMEIQDNFLSMQIQMLLVIFPYQLPKVREWLLDKIVEY